VTETSVIVANDFSEILQCLDKLAAPRAGKVRVFRGQTRQYLRDTGTPSLLPAIDRPNAIPFYEPYWHRAAERYIETVCGIDTSTVLAHRHVWGPALLQHYGAHSAFLDVTSDVAAALWFSLNTYVEQWLSTQSSDAADEVPVILKLATYSEVLPGRPGPVLYVLDVDQWNDGRPIEHGDYLDLLALKTGGVLANAATRLRAQAASLIFARSPTAGYPDLGTLIVAVIELGPLFDRRSVPHMNRVTSDLFPPPDKDPWYRHLLDLPYSLQFEQLRFEHPLSPPCYVDRLPISQANKSAKDSPSHLDTETRRACPEVEPYLALSLPKPPFYRRWLSTSDAAGSDVRSRRGTPFKGANEAFESATVFVLQAPVFTIFPEVRPDGQPSLWIDSSLPIGLPWSLDGRDLSSVYIELAPSEAASGLTDHILRPRGIWSLSETSSPSPTASMSSAPTSALFAENSKRNSRNPSLTRSKPRSRIRIPSRTVTSATGIRSASRAGPRTTTSRAWPGSGKGIGMNLPPGE